MTTTTLQTIPDGTTVELQQGDRIGAINGKLYLVRGQDPAGLVRELAAGRKPSRFMAYAQGPYGL